MLVTSGNYINLMGTTVAMRPELAGMVIADVIREFRIPGNPECTGKIQDRIVRGADMKLTYYYRVTELRGANLESVTPFLPVHYGPLLPEVDVDFRTDGLGQVSPALAHHLGGAVQFWFRPALTPTQSSRFFFIKAPVYRSSNDGKIRVMARFTSGGSAYVDITGCHQAIPP